MSFIAESRFVGYIFVAEM